MRSVSTLAALLLLPMTLDAQSPASAIPPVAKVVPKTDTLHGEPRVDDYFYMRDKANPEVIKYLEAENAYTAAMTRHTESLEKQLYDEMLARIKEDDSQVPVKREGWFEYSRTEKGKAYPIFCRKHGSLDAPEEVFFDQNEAAKGHKFYNLGGFEVSPNHQYLALLVDTSGYEDFVLQVKDLSSGTMLADRVEKLGLGLAWASDNATVFYETTDSAKRADQVWRHRLGEARAKDVSVYKDADVLFNVAVSRSRSGAFIFLQSGSFTSSEVWALDAAKPDAKPVLIAKRASD